VGTGTELAELERKLARVELPSAPVAYREYLRYLFSEILPHTANTRSPRCLGHMTGPVPEFLWDVMLLIGALNQNLAKREASMVFTALERQTVATLHRLAYQFDPEYYQSVVHDERSSCGIVTSGGTLANLTALWIARNHAFPTRSGFAGVEAAGLSQALRSQECADTVIVGSAAMHYSVDKSAGLLGLGEAGVRKVPVDGSLRIDVSELRRILREISARGVRVIAVIGVAGNTDAGSIDRLDAVADAAAECGAWFHVDAAWGAPLLFSARERHKLAGLQRADSITVDGHKQMCLPIGASVLLLKDRYSAAVIEKQSRYMLQENSGDLGMRSLEGSRPASALLFHAGLHVIGPSGYEQIMDTHLDKARLLAARIQRRPEFQLLIEPETNIVLYRYVPRLLRGRSLSAGDYAYINAYNEAIQRAQSAAGRSFVSRTTIYPGAHRGNGDAKPVVALRAVLVNPKTTEADLDTVLDDQVRIALELENRFRPEAEPAMV
jgi:glutamate decarboxylase